jgi:peptidoglycan/LPS O-acetylase OafA/YrhL
LSSRQGFGPGFDFLRVALSVSVVGWHAHYVVSGKLAGGIDLDQSQVLWFPGYALLVMFFGLSGFLIAASGLRLSLKNFLINRGLRIVPALAVEVVLCMLLLGPIFTTLPLASYFTQAGTLRYLTNIFGLVNYFLPGVFTANPAPEVNNSLWTVPFEYACYAVMAAFMVLGILRKPGLVLLGAALLVGGGVALQLGGFAAPSSYVPTAEASTGFIDKLLSTTLFMGRGSRLLVAFLLGIAAYLYKDRIAYDWRIFAACVALCLGIAIAGPAPWLTMPVLNALVGPALLYITVFLGVTDLPKIPFFSQGDYSYGIYLYGFPVQQAVWSLAPTLSGPVQFIVSLALVTGFAALSWHAIEKPILGLRRRFSFVARQRLDVEQPDSTAAVKAPLLQRS